MLPLVADDPSSTGVLSLLKTPFAMSQLNLARCSYSLPTTCSRSFSRFFLRFGKAFGVELRSKPRFSLFAISS